MPSALDKPSCNIYIPASSYLPSDAVGTQADTTSVAATISIQGRCDCKSNTLAPVRQLCTPTREGQCSIHHFVLHISPHRANRTHSHHCLWASACTGHTTFQLQILVPNTTDCLCLTGTSLVDARQVGHLYEVAAAADIPAHRSQAIHRTGAANWERSPPCNLPF